MEIFWSQTRVHRPLGLQGVNVLFIALISSFCAGRPIQPISGNVHPSDNRLKSDQMREKEAWGTGTGEIRALCLLWWDGAEDQS